jgi:6-phosphogluconate dehydrogenase
LAAIGRAAPKPLADRRLGSTLCALKYATTLAARRDDRSRLSAMMPAASPNSGEGRWTIKAAIDEAVPPHVFSAALYDRLASRGEAEFATKLLPAMRYEFGGHGEKPGG